ncbi:hypothetical protein [Thiomicrorhabdus aquaedulcis]|nr:hypothetical protein [Thiomicrorhabdus aquaedulcis]
MSNDAVSRPTRVAYEIKKTLAQMLLREAKDPRFQKLTLPNAKSART